MLKLYGGARTRASLVAWYLEELGQPYEAVAVDLAAGEHRQQPFLALNPFGKVPAVVDDEFSLWESGAILLYLAEKFGELQTLQDRAVAAQWVLFANATLGPGLFVEANRAKEAPRLLGSLNTLLSQRDYLVGDRLGVADIAVGSYLAYVPMFFPDFDLSPYPAVQSYISRLTQRPAYQNTIGRR